MVGYRGSWHHVSVKPGTVVKCTNAQKSILKEGRLYVVMLVVNVGEDYHGPCAGYVVSGFDHEHRFLWPYVWDRSRFTPTNHTVPDIHKVTVAKPNT